RPTLCATHLRTSLRVSPPGSQGDQLPSKRGVSLPASLSRQGLQETPRPGRRRVLRFDDGDLCLFCPRDRGHEAVAGRSRTQFGLAFGRRLRGPGLRTTPDEGDLGLGWLRAQGRQLAFGLDLDHRRGGSRNLRRRRCCEWVGSGLWLVRELTQFFAERL